MEIPKLPDTLRTEDEIIATWKGDISKPLVSVRCITYNHAPYIEDAIKGFLIQETDFPIEVWIHDDASTDGTREIVESYQKQYPRIIKTILQDENQYSNGVKPSSFLNLCCEGDYYASCEGDDCWTHPRKLSLQVSALEKIPGVDISFHPALVCDYALLSSSFIGVYRERDEIIPLCEVIRKEHGQIPTASVLIRRAAHEEFQEFRSQHPYLVVGDIYVHFFGAKKGGAHYMNLPMSAYRLNTEGSFNDRYKKSSELRFKHVSSRVASYLALEEVDGVDHDIAKALRKSSASIICGFLKNPANPYLKRVKILNKYSFLLNFKQKAFVYPLTVIPFFLNAVRPVAKLLKKLIHRLSFGSMARS